MNHPRRVLLDFFLLVLLNRPAERVRHLHRYPAFPRDWPVKIMQLKVEEVVDGKKGAGWHLYIEKAGGGYEDGLWLKG